jgi:RNA polymerase sigma-70 factor (ECF subfamily)
VAATLEQLSRQERTAFVLRHFEGQSIEEIGTSLGLSGNATKHSIFRAVQKLRRALEPLVNSAGIS